MIALQACQATAVAAPIAQRARTMGRRRICFPFPHMGAGSSRSVAGWPVRLASGIFQISNALSIRRITWRRTSCSTWAATITGSSALRISILKGSTSAKFSHTPNTSVGAKSTGAKDHDRIGQRRLHRPRRHRARLAGFSGGTADPAWRHPQPSRIQARGGVHERPAGRGGGRRSA